jgi:hypothetical protein
MLVMCNIKQPSPAHEAGVARVMIVGYFLELPEPPSVR